MVQNNEGNGKVIDMADFAGEPRFPAVAEVEAYWDGLRRGRVVPCRSDIDPRGIEHALEYAFILERIAPGLARLRIAGMHLNDLMGMETRGMPISSLISPATRSGFSGVLEQVMSTPAVAKLRLSAETGIGKPALEGRMLLCPLESDMGDVSRVIGCLSTNGAIGHGPRRFDLVGTEMRDLLRDAKPDFRFEQNESVTEGKKFAPGLAETQRPFETGNRKRPSYLRLVKSDD